MIGSDSTDPKSQSWTRPLCRSYLLVIHGRLAVEVRDGGNLRSEPVRWALGVLTDGSYEVLGAWTPPDSSSWSWQDAVEGLRVRGVERIGFVFELGCEPPRAMYRSHLRTLHRSKAVVRQLERRACRAIKKHQPCSNVLEVEGFVEDILSRAELQMNPVGTSLEAAIGSMVEARRSVGRGNRRKSVAFSR